MRALRVVVADGGQVPRGELLALCERVGFDVVGEAVDWASVPDLVTSRAADLVLVGGEPDFAAGVQALNGIVASIVLAPDAASTKEYASCGASVVVTPSVEPEMLRATAQSAVARAADLLAARREIDKLKELLETRKLVERAKGVLMRRLGIEEDAAYRRIQRASQDENRKMGDIAESILSAERLYTPSDAAASPPDRAASPPDAGTPPLDR